MIAGDRAERPLDLAPENDAPRLTSCPFCAGREAETTKAVAVWPPADSATHGHPWQLRIVPNLYPAFVPVAEPGGDADSTDCQMTSLGQHDVVIESPQHLTRLTELEEAEACMVFQAYRERLLAYATDAQLTYGIVFKNCGAAAGMSREHIHSQVVGLPFIPPTVAGKLSNAAEFHRRTGQCLFCATIEKEVAESIRVVLQTARLVAICPFASRFSYETWVLPRTHQASFETSADDLLSELSNLMLEILRRLEAVIPRPAYNYVVHTSPFDRRWKDHYHWHIEVIPRLSRLAGLECGAGVHINTVPPELAADRLRNLTSA